jgi:formate hydrogenlyase subunit 3/multisubunit Na+/H+ antiporter MnhD subunit
MTTSPAGSARGWRCWCRFVGVLAGFALGGRNAQRVATVTILAGLGIAIAIAAAMARSGDAAVYLLGGWAPPLGIALRADALSVVMMLAVAVVICGIGVYARADFGTPRVRRRAPRSCSDAAARDLGLAQPRVRERRSLHLYVALELLTFAAVPLRLARRQAETLRAALRYLLYALLGSVFYLLARSCCTARTAPWTFSCCPSGSPPSLRRWRRARS